MNKINVMILGGLAGILTWIDSASLLAITILEMNILGVLLIPSLLALLVLSMFPNLTSEPLFESILLMVKQYFEKGALFILGVSVAATACFTVTGSDYALKTSMLAIIIAVTYNFLNNAAYKVLKTANPV